MIPLLSGLSVFIGVGKTTGLSSSDTLNLVPFWIWVPVRIHSFLAESHDQNPLLPSPASHNLIFSGLGFSVSSGRGFCGSASGEVPKVDFLHWLGEYLPSRLPQHPQRFRAPHPSNGGEGSQFLKFPDHTSVSHSSSNTVPVCSLCLLFGSLDLVTPMSS